MANRKRTLDEARRALDTAIRAGSVDIHPHAYQHHVRPKQILEALMAGEMGYGETPAGERERYVADLQFRTKRSLRVVFILEGQPCYCLVIAAYEKE